MRSNRGQLLDGVRAQLPILLGVAPFGMIYGILAVEAGCRPAPLGMSLIVFAGRRSSSPRNYSQGAARLIIMLTTFMSTCAALSGLIAIRPPQRRGSRRFLLTTSVRRAINHYAPTPEARRVTTGSTSAPG